jgi:hypothetical protein
MSIIKIGYIAQFSSLNPSALSRDYKKDTGNTLKEYIDRKIIESI